MRTSLNSGLEGIVAAETRLSMVDGERGELVIGGFRVEELASWTFEDTVELLWAAVGFDGRPTAAPLPSHAETLLREIARERVPVMDALRMAAGTLREDDDAAAARMLVGTFPTIVAAYWRMLHEEEPIAPRADLGIAANYLYMLSGTEPNAELVRGMETYLNTVVDHGLNASTFTARVIASTGSDFVSAIVGAVGALKGALHGGAPGPALDMVFEIAEASHAEDVLRRKIGAGERLMGFGHRVYKVRDPRADVLAAAAERMFTRAGDMRLYELARAVEATALRLLEEHKPGRKLQTNVEFYTALLLHGLGLDVPLFTPTFAISRVAGWTAHCLEQRRVGRLIRPQSVYVGALPA
ncbi:MAG TPA: citrate synthase/methylcitrate synthase [Thermoanaerobaculia bacterium]|nr:citrate synthase/methylcitrate synthase [Thermoanaerobaculia bacterium]